MYSLKLRISFILLLLVCFSSVHSQNDSTEIINTLESIRADLDEIKKRITEDSIIQDITGKIYFLEEINLYQNDTIAEKISIVEVQIYLKDGMLTSVRCKDDKNRIFYHSELNIFLGALEGVFEARKGTREKKLYNIEFDKTQYILAYDFLRYESNIGNHFLPETSVITLTKEKRSVNLSKNIDANSHLSFKVYSDLLGLIESEPNGLIQFELSSEITLMNEPRWANTVYWLNYIKPSLGFRRYDSSASRLDISNEPNLQSLSEQTYFDIIQRSFLTVGLDFNLIKVSSRSFKVEINAGYNFSYTNVLMPDSTTNKVTYSTTKIGVNYEILRYDNFGINIDLDFWDPFLTQRKDLIPEYQYTLLDFGVEVFYYPLNNKNNQIYARFNYLNPVGNISSVRGQPTLQLGYKSILKPNKST